MVTDKRLRIQGGKKERLLGSLIGWITKIISTTMCCRIHDPHHVIQLPQPFILCFWHGYLLPTTIAWDKATTRAHTQTCLTSSSRDGAIIAAFMKTFQISSIRGSTSRRAISALLELKKALLHGNDVAITPDGPRGPAHIFQGGAIKLAQLTGHPIAPFSVHCSATWQLSTWDSFRIPLPFSTIRIHIHAPIHVPRHAADATLEALRETLQTTLSQSTANH